MDDQNNKTDINDENQTQVQSPISDHSEAEITPEPVDEVQAQIEKELTEKAIENTGAPEEAERAEGETSAISHQTSDSSNNEVAGESKESEEAKEIEETKGTEESEADGKAEEEANDLRASNPKAKWYIIHTYSGHENKVATALKQRIESEHLDHKILDILVPTQEKIEIKGGKKSTVKEKIFPGYILVLMELDDTTWLAVRTTQGVTAFVGIGNKPTPVPESEVRTIVKYMTQEAAPTFKEVFAVNDTVKIIDGPFAEFIGKIDSVDKEKGKVRVLVSIFGRETPVELDFLQVAKL